MSRTQQIVIIGATSAMAQHTARLYATPDAHFLLIARSKGKLQEVSQDLTARGATADIMLQDLDDPSAGKNILARMPERTDILIYAAGTLADNEDCLKDPSLTTREITANYMTPTIILTHLIPYFERTAQGVIAVLTSVAGDRGRQSNFVYGSAKAGTSAFVDGLRAWFRPKGVHVLLVKPGPTDTPMTQNAGATGPFMVGPEVIARDIKKAIDRRYTQIYTPAIWFFIMNLLRLIPNRIFDRLKF